MGFKTSTSLPLARPVDPDALRQLHDAYIACTRSGEGKARHPWTTASCVFLGKLFTVAWGKLPPFTHLRPEYGMPGWRVIREHWTTIAAYHAALLHCGCTQTMRCAAAQALHTQWQDAQWPTGQQDMHPAGILTAYRAHLRAAGVWPGTAQWKGDRSA